MKEKKLPEGASIQSPDPFGTIDSMRAYGYNFTEAISDIIDNSITAKCKNIWINMHYEQEDSWIRIEDDGIGMSPLELVDAMVFGRKPKNNIRDPQDLGRFGFGLKTASISQARRLSVLSKSDGNQASVAVWDLDEVHDQGDWILYHKALDDTSTKRLGELGEDNMGTVVLWEKPDRLIQESVNSPKDIFFQLGSNLFEHLGCKYHRFLEKKQISIFYNGEPVSAFNPFSLPVSELRNFGGATYGENISVRAYLLPHESKMTHKDLQMADGFKGFFDHQGIYLYRNNRLMIMGEWLNTGFKKTESSKLLRVKIDIENNNDEEWRIDVRKTAAMIPDSLVSEIRMLLLKARDEASKRYRFRKKKVKIKKKEGEKEQLEMWEKSATRKGFRYMINKKHPLVENFKKLLKDGSINNKEVLVSHFNALISHLEEMVPVTDIIATYSENTFVPGEPYEDKKQRKQNIGALIKTMESQGFSEREIFEFIENSDLT